MLFDIYIYIYIYIYLYKVELWGPDWVGEQEIGARQGCNVPTVLMYLLTA